MQLVLGGGKGTFTTVKETLKIGIPVVIIEVNKIMIIKQNETDP